MIPIVKGEGQKKVDNSRHKDLEIFWKSLSGQTNVTSTTLLSEQDK